MSVLLLARTAVVTAVTGAVLLSGLTVAGVASAAPDKSGDLGSTSASETKVLKAPTLTVSHGRRLG